MPPSPGGVGAVAAAAPDVAGAERLLAFHGSSAGALNAAMNAARGAAATAAAARDAAAARLRELNADDGRCGICPPPTCVGVGALRVRPVSRMQIRRCARASRTSCRACGGSWRRTRRRRCAFANGNPDELRVMNHGFVTIAFCVMSSGVSLISRRSRRSRPTSRSADSITSCQVRRAARVLVVDAALSHARARVHCPMHAHECRRVCV